MMPEEAMSRETVISFCMHVIGSLPSGKSRTAEEFSGMSCAQSVVPVLRKPGLFHVDLRVCCELVEVELPVLLDETGDEREDLLGFELVLDLELTPELLAPDMFDELLLRMRTPA